ncbi:MAG: hypothetical protein ACUVX8_02485 [Candidatus Zipacnadales bacterium]
MRILHGNNLGRHRRGLRRLVAADRIDAPSWAHETAWSGCWLCAVFSIRARGGRACGFGGSTAACPT